MTRWPLSALLPAALLGLTACADPLPPADECDAGSYIGLVGRHSSTITLPSGPGFRHYTTGDPVTLDYAPGRVNFEYDDKGYLTAVNCG